MSDSLFDAEVVDVREESSGVPCAERIALATSLQAIFVLASRTAATQDTTPGPLLAELATIFPPCLSLALHHAGDPDELLRSLELPESVTPYIDQGWALAVGEPRDRLRAPGRTPATVWQTQLRVAPIIGVLNGDYGGVKFFRPAPERDDIQVRPLGHAEGSMAQSVRLADELNRPSGYGATWRALVTGAALLPPLADLTDVKPWLWHVDSLLRVLLYGVPAYWEGLHDAGEPLGATRDTLLDQSRLAGAIAVCLFRHALHTLKHGPTRPKPESPLALISGEMAPIQDYLFGYTADPGAPANSIELGLRGRSSFLRLAVEVAAYRLCDQMHLPPGCVLMSAASKFTLLAPNTRECRAIMGALQVEMDAWALAELQGRTGLCLARSSLTATGLENRALKNGVWRRVYGRGGAAALLGTLAGRAAHAGRQRFQLCRQRVPHSPHRSDQWSAPIYLNTRRTGRIEEFQGHLARALASADPMAVLRRHEPGSPPPDTATSMSIFGYAVSIESRHDALDHGTLEGPQMTWDLRCSSDSDAEPRWLGRCKKPLAINSRRTPTHPPARRGRFWQILKGDVDHLGIAFQSQTRIPESSLARVAILSREVEEFFSITVQNRLAREFSHLVTVFSGGDDFIFMGPPDEIIDFSCRLHAAFKAHGQDRLSLSVGLSPPFQQGASIADAVDEADDALELAKETRNTVGFANVSWEWPHWTRVAERTRDIRDLLIDESLSLKTAQVIAEKLFRSQQSTGTIDVCIDIEALLIRVVNDKHKRQALDCDPAALAQVNASRAALVDKLKSQLLFDSATSSADHVLVPLTLAYATLP